jgi:large subunit ribosomal protein L3e
MEDIILESFRSLEGESLASRQNGILELQNLLEDLASSVQESSARKTATSRKQTSRNKSFTSAFFSTPKVCEFLSLQDNFTFNIAGRVADFVSKLVDTPEGKQMLLDTVSRLQLISEHRKLLAPALQVIHGACIMHGRSRRCFSTRHTMMPLITCLKVVENPSVQIGAVNALVAVMAHEVANIRLFEDLDGLAVICLMFKRKETSKEVKLKILEFLFFYLVPETQRKDRLSHPDGIKRMNTDDKQKLLARYLSNVNGLVRELYMSKPFGDMDLEW